MYRDPRCSAEARLACLEERVREQAQENALLREQLVRRNQAVVDVVHRAQEQIERRQRWWRITAVSATVVAAVFASVAFALILAPASPPEPEQLGLLLEIPKVELEPQDLYTPYSAPEPHVHRHTRLHRETDRFDTSAQKRALTAKMMSGRAGMDELRMLKAICLAEGDRRCRDLAVAEMNRRRPSLD